MNDAHLHLVVNHFPIVGVIFGLGILVAGMLLKNNAVKNTAYILFLVVAVFAFLSMQTGEGAEEIAEKIPGAGKNFIHDHEELAETFAAFAYATAFSGLLSLIFYLKKPLLFRVLPFITLVMASTTVVLAKSAGTSGGEIRHTEIRTSGQTPLQIDSERDDVSLNR